MDWKRLGAIFIAIVTVVGVIFAAIALLPRPTLDKTFCGAGLTDACTPTPLPTNSPTSTPLPSATPIVSGMILLDETFGNQTRSNLLTNGNDISSCIKSDYGNAVYDNRSNLCGSLGFGLWNWGDYSITYRFRVLEDSKNTFIGVAFRMQDYSTDKCCSEYILNFDSNMRLIRLLIADSQPEWVSIQDKSFELETNKWYSVRVRTAGNTIEIYVNSELIIRTTDNRLDRGAISWYFGEQTHAQFDDLRVTAIEAT